MAEQSKIEWTDATWNPVVGCRKVSAGCANCYAEVMAARLKAMALADIVAGKDPGRKRHYIDAIDDHGRWSGILVPVPESLADPFRWMRPRKVFVNSMSDLFHASVPFDFVDRVLMAAAINERHTFQILTKRAPRMARYFSERTLGDAIATCRRYHFDSNAGTESDRTVALRYSHQDQLKDVDIEAVANSPITLPQAWPLRNVILGTSVEHQKAADGRFEHLCDLGEAGWRTMASVEPLLGPVVIPDRYLALGNRAWVIVGGESGLHARPMQSKWARALRDQCDTAGVPFFFKQWGEWLPEDEMHREPVMNEHGWTTGYKWPADNGSHFTDDGDMLYRVGKKAAGRTLDGRMHDEFPSPAPN